MKYTFIVLFVAALTSFGAEPPTVTSKTAKELLKHPEFKKALETAPEFTKAVLQRLDNHAVEAEKKFAETLAKAINGEADAQLNIGWMYRRGLGVKEDHKQAVVWWRKAANQGNALGQFYLGSMNEYGLGVDGKDFVTAYAWYKILKSESGVTRVAKEMTLAQIAKGKAFADAFARAMNGDANARFNIGLMYRNGRGIKENHKQSVEWWHKAAVQRHVRAQYHLATMIESGIGVEADLVTAYAWYKILASNGHAASKWTILAPLTDAERESTAKLTEISKPTAEKMTPAQIAKGKALAKEMIEKNPKLILKKK